MGQTFQSLDFSGTRTAITDNGGNTIGFSFADVYGDGTDAIMDVTWNASASSHPDFFSTGVSDDLRSPHPSERLGSLIISSGASQHPTLTTEDPKSLAIYIRPRTPSSFDEGKITTRIDFSLHNAAGDPIISALPLRFITRDIDGDSEGPSAPYAETFESVTPYGATDITLLDPSFLSLTGERIASAQSVNINPSAGDTSATAFWNINSPTFSMDLDMEMVRNGGEYSFDDSYWSRGYVFDASTQPIPEPSSIALLGLGGMTVLLRRRR